MLIHAIPGNLSARAGASRNGLCLHPDIKLPFQNHEKINLSRHSSHPVCDVCYGGDSSLADQKMKREGAAVTDTQNHESGFITQQLGKGKTILRIMLKNLTAKSPSVEMELSKEFLGHLEGRVKGDVGCFCLHILHSGEKVILILK